jgi:hypothetical protein
MTFMKLNLTTVDGLMGFITHVFHQKPTSQRRALAQSIINNNLRPLITDMERADQRGDFAAMLSIPAAHHKLLGQWIEVSASAYTWNVLVSSDPNAQEVRKAFFPADAATTRMALGGAVFRLTSGHDDDSEQTADIVQFMRLDEERSYDKMLTLCTSNHYVKDMWQVLLGYKIKMWNLIQDDAKGVVGARAVATVVFVI